MASFIIFLIILAMAGTSDAAWCICRSDVSNTALQKTLDYACGAGADCSPILLNGACHNPNTMIAHCSYAANSYYQRKGQTHEACDFTGTAMITSNDPSANGCAYPATARSLTCKVTCYSDSANFRIWTYDMYPFYHQCCKLFKHANQYKHGSKLIHSQHFLFIHRDVRKPERIKHHRLRWK